MRRRTYFLLPDMRRAHSTYHELLAAGIGKRHIHVLAKEGTPLGELPEAGVLQKSDALHGAGLGLLAGAITGALAGIVLTLLPRSDFGGAIGLVLGMSLLGAVMGVWVSGMIGASTPSTHLEAFSEEIAHGRVLLIVDVPRGRRAEISRMVRAQHPEVREQANAMPSPLR